MEARELELLQAIETMMDIKLDTKLDIKLKDIKDDIKELKTDVKDLKKRMTKVELVIENEIRPDIKLIAETQRALYDKVKYLPEEVGNLKETVSVLQFVQNEMAKKISMKQ